MPRKSAIPPRTIRAILRLAREKHWSMAELSARFGWSTTTIAKMLNQHNVRSGLKAPRLTADEKTIIVSMTAQGKKCRDIAAFLGRPLNSTRQHQRLLCGGVRARMKMNLVHELVNGYVTMTPRDFVEKFFRWSAKPGIAVTTTDVNVAADCALATRTQFFGAPPDTATYLSGLRSAIAERLAPAGIQPIAPGALNTSNLE